MTKFREAGVVSAPDLKPPKTTKPYSLKEQKKRGDTKRKTRIKKNKLREGGYT